MDFKEVQDFFKSWGVYPNQEDTDDFNPDVIQQGINRACYRKLTAEANDQWGANFAEFCSIMIDAVDDAFYLQAGTWADLEAAWGRHTVSS